MTRKSDLKSYSKSESVRKFLDFFKKSGNKTSSTLFWGIKDTSLLPKKRTEIGMLHFRTFRIFLYCLKRERAEIKVLTDTVVFLKIYEQNYDFQGQIFRKLQKMTLLRR